LQPQPPRLLCALIHKFDLDLKGPKPPVHGRFYAFVDECHRTQGGDMNRQMKRRLEGAMFIGFTGTPLLRQDPQTTQDVFGIYIHTYKFHEAVADKGVLDLKYDARVFDCLPHDSLDGCRRIPWNPWHALGIQLNAWQRFLAW
jgi:type I restriction enzyme, R subunit